MLSFTFSSNKTSAPEYRRAIAAVLVLLLVAGLALEGVVRLEFPRISRIAARIHREYAGARAVRPGTTSRPSILLVGNSLLLEGVDYDALRRALPADLTRFVLENTNYFDWYYGLKRLFAEGSRPDQVLLFLSIPQLLENDTLGEYGAFYLLRPRDLPRLKQLTGYDLTKASGLLLGYFSLYYAAHNQIRNYLLNRGYPAYGSLLHHLLSDIPARPVSDEKVFRLSSERLRNLQALCALYGARFQFVLPPGFGTGDGALLEAGRHSQTRVLVPVRLGAYSPDRFLDRFHLNAGGAAQFTRMLVSALDVSLIGAAAGGSPTAPPAL